MQEHFSAYRGAEISPAKAMVTTRNQGSQQNHYREDPAAILAKLKQELEAIRKLREEDRMRHAGALDILHEEN